MSNKIPVRGGRKGQQHRATPDDLRSYSISPASPVTVTRADGTTATQAAKSARKTAPASQRRSPAVCAMCADPIEGTVWVSRERGACRGKPVHPACEKRNRAAATQLRAAKQEAKRQAKKDRPLSLVEENRLLLARQDKIREQRQSRSALKWPLSTVAARPAG
ncbi:hypothetical protein [Streptomyces sp. IGB124]|uniref:hypothetical protein n=1 Tax=Streptomyces sp. IGB124 TaxID=1519485 RepID=UPI0006AE209A|nr:hypothetical protein [Streptomyces sp. IGB124]KOU62700.1 hypothetical protein ADK96_25870 [Streptomyces sp. IGB124]